MAGDIVRFVHCGDLHLDAPFDRLEDIPGGLAPAIHGAPLRCWERIVTLAIERGVDFVLLAGDLFDDVDRTLRAQLALVKGLERLSGAGIGAFIVCGNHDSLAGWEARLPFPPGVYRFGGTAESLPFVRGGKTVATVTGYSYPQRRVEENVARLLRPSGEGFQIALLHANVGHRREHGDYAPCALEDLVASGMDYWALGHIHAPGVLREASPAVVYPGIPQGRRAHETGPRGCYVVTLGRGAPDLEFVETDLVRRERRGLDIASLGTEQELVRALEALRNDVRLDGGRGVLLRVELRGRGELHDTLIRPGIVTDLVLHLREGEELREDFVWTEALEDRTASWANREALSQEDHFVGDFLRSVEALEGAEDLVARVTALLDADPEGAGWNDRNVVPLVEELLRQEAEEIFDQVKTRGLDGLLRQEG
ncbi:MAG TPA: DNA repair exonuclease [Synergistaceae bacterium]|nr:DNA repair exonuclease [Synergistaceae bacterium]HQH78398.1 DNA repair exonuclease [Synergistaceae bacterium]